jgi:hypothetical protein
VSFRHRRQLKIVSGDKTLSSPEYRFPRSWKKYWEVFPRIFVEDGDAVAAALENGQGLRLEKYDFNCLRGKMRADVGITPVMEKGE